MAVPRVGGLFARADHRDFGLRRQPPGRAPAATGRLAGSRHRLRQRRREHPGRARSSSRSTKPSCPALETVQGIVEDSQPDVIFHLAAQPVPSLSRIDPWYTLENNVRLQVNVLQAIVHVAPKAVTLVIGSSEEYGQVAEADLPLTENAPLRPTSPYAVSKIAQDFLGLQYHLSHGVAAIRMRPFNHIGPAAAPGLCRAGFRVADRRDRSRSATARDERRPARRCARLLGRARHCAGLRAGGAARRAGRGVQYRRVRGAHGAGVARRAARACGRQDRSAARPRSGCVRSTRRGSWAIAPGSAAGRDGNRRSPSGRRCATCSTIGEIRSQTQENLTGFVKPVRFVSRVRNHAKSIGNGHHRPGRLVPGRFPVGQGYEVIGMVRRTSTINFDRMRHIQDKITIVQGDLLDQVSLINMLQEHRPDEVYNLAAQSFVPTSFQQPVLTGEFTGLGVTRVLDAIRIVDRAYPLLPGVLLRDVRQGAGSAAAGDHPVLPAQPVRRRPSSTATGSRSTTARATTCSPARASCSTTSRPAAGLEFVTHKITHQAARIKLGLAQELRLGNLDARRDWGFAPDYVRAMWLMLQHDRPDDYVVATGETHAVREFCQVAFDCLGLDWEKHVVVDPQVLPPGRGRSAGRRPEQGEAGAGLGAERHLPRPGSHYGRGRYGRRCRRWAITRRGSISRGDPAWSTRS